MKSILNLFFLISLASAGYRVNLIPQNKTSIRPHETANHHPVVGEQRINNIDNHEDLQYYGDFMFGAN